MNGKPRRRCLRYSIRTLLIAVTALSVWLASNVRFVREREDLRGLMMEHGYSYWPPEQPLSPHWIRRLLGDTIECGSDLYLCDDYSAGDVERIRAAFPKCVVSVTPREMIYA